MKIAFLINDNTVANNEILFLSFWRKQAGEKSDILIIHNAKVLKSKNFPAGKDGSLGFCFISRN